MKDSHPGDCLCCSGGPDALFSKIAADIGRVGHSVINTSTVVNGMSVAMSYTVGLAEAGLTEIIVFGLPEFSAMAILNAAAKHARDPGLPLDTPVERICNFPVVFKAVPALAAVGHLNVANRRAKQDLPALQLVLPDAAGLFPWDEGFNEEMRKFFPVLSSRVN